MLKYQVYDYEGAGVGMAMYNTDEVSKRLAVSWAVMELSELPQTELASGS